MPKVVLTKERRQAEKILKRVPNQSELARQIGISRQLMNHRFKEVYPGEIADLIILLDFAGYEIKEKE